MHKHGAQGVGPVTGRDGRSGRREERVDSAVKVRESQTRPGVGQCTRSSGEVERTAA